MTVTAEEVVNEFVKWRSLFIGKLLKRKPHWCDMTCDELFHEIIVQSVPKVVRNCDDPKRIQTYVARAADWYISNILVWAYHQRGFVLYDSREEDSEGVLNHHPFFEHDRTSESVKNDEMQDAWSWILYRALPEHKRWIDAYVRYSGVVKEIAKRMSVSRQTVHNHLNKFCDQAKELIRIRGVPLGFRLNFTEEMEYRGGFCKRCGKILKYCQDDYCSEECRKVGPLKRAQERWKRELRGARVLSKRVKEKN